MSPNQSLFHHYFVIRPHLGKPVSGLGVTWDLLLGLLVQDDVEQEDEDALEGVQQREDDGHPLGPVGEVGEPEDPGEPQDTEQREGPWINGFTY